MTVFASLFLLAVTPLLGNSESVIGENATAKEIVACCRSTIPSNVEISGHINRRSRHGVSVAAYRYNLKRINGETSLEVFNKEGEKVSFEKGGRLLDTDVTWSDLTLDYLWWGDYAIDAEKDGESVQTISCKVIVFRQAAREVRVWIDPKTGALVQAEESENGKVTRRLFGTSIKKFGDRWAPHNIEVGTPGSKYRTKIVIDELK